MACGGLASGPFRSWRTRAQLTGSLMRQPGWLDWKGVTAFCGLARAMQCPPPLYITPGNVCRTLRRVVQKPGGRSRPGLAVREMEYAASLQMRMFGRLVQ